MAIKITRADKCYSLLIKHRAGNKCERCGRTDGKMDCSHHISRAVKVLRFDPRNACCLCYQCHLWWHSSPIESGAWLIGLIGQDKIEYLLHRGNQPFKFDKAMQAHITKRLEQMWHIASTTGLKEFPSPYPKPGELPDAIQRKSAPKKAKGRKLSHPKLKRKVNGQVVPREKAA